MDLSSTPITQLLGAWNDGDRAALDALMVVVYDELRQLAAGIVGPGCGPCDTLQPTVLVNEAYLRLLRVSERNWQNRAAFFKFAAEVMRNLMISHIRHKTARKRGRDTITVPIDLVELPWQPNVAPEQLIDLENVLRTLEDKDMRLATIIKLRFFVGCTENETAEILGVARSTVQREWRVGKRLVAAQAQTSAQAS